MLGVFILAVLELPTRTILADSVLKQLDCAQEVYIATGKKRTCRTLLEMLAA